MISLFIDSSKKSLLVALARENKLLFISNTPSYNKHSNFLMNTIIKSLKDTNLTIYDIDNIIVLNGPGSFTGVRVGVTIAKTIAWVLSKKLYVINNLKALNVQDDSDSLKINVIYDKDSASYVGIYNQNTFEAYCEIDKIPAFKNKEILIITETDNIYVNNLYNNLIRDNHVKIKNVSDDYDCLKVVNYALSKNNINPHEATPIYLKKIDVEKR